MPELIRSANARKGDSGFEVFFLDDQKMTSQELIAIANGLLSYDPSIGSFYRKLTKGKLKPTGWKNANGYIYLGIGKRKYLAHRIAWLMTYGEFPSCDIDHINGVRSDNRIDNLRAATRAENLQNTRRPNARNTSGFMGITLHRQSGRWNARICTNGKVKSLGYFDSKEAAAAAYLDAKRTDHSFCTI